MAEELGITIKFQGEAIGFDESVSGMEKAINTLKKEVRWLNKDLKIDPNNIVTLTNKMRNLYQQLVLQRKITQDWRNTIKGLSENGQQFTKEWTEAQTKLGESLDKTREIEKQMANLNTQIERSNSSLAKFGDTMGKISETSGRVAQAFQPISQASQNFLKTATQNAIDFESAFADVKKTVNTTDFYDEDYVFGILADSAKEMSTYLPKSASEIAKLMGLAGQMNVPANQIKDFTEAMIKFGDSTNITAEEAITDIAQIYNVIGKGGNFDDLDQLLSTIVELGNNSATTEKDITTMFKNISAGASRVKMTEAQMVALSATLSSLGLDKGGASAISKIMTNIDMAVTDSGEKMQEWAKIAGMSGDAFKKAWGDDSAKVLLDIVTSMSEMTDEGISMNKILSDLDIKELRQVDTLSRLVKAHDEYAKNIALANGAYEAGTALNTEAEKRYETLASQIEIVRNNFQLFAITLGETLMPYIQELIDWLMKMADWLNKLSPEMQRIIVKALAILAVIAPIFGWLSKITGGISIFIDMWMNNLFPALTTVFGFIQNFLSTTFASILGFATRHPILTAIVALIAIGVVLYKNCVEFRNEVILLWRTFQQTNWIDALGEKFGWLGSVIGWLMELVKNLLNWFIRLIERITEFLGISSGLGGVAETARQAVGGNSWNVLNSGGFGALNSGGFNSGGVTLNANFSVNSNNITRSDVHAWAEWMADDINDILGRKIR